MLDAPTYRRTGAPTLCLLAALVLAAAPLAAQERGGFITRLGNDTVAMERFTLTAGRLEGEIVSRVPQVSVRTYTIEYDAGGRPTRAELTVRRPGQPNPVQSITARFSRDSVMVESRRDTTVQTRRIALASPAVVVPAGPGASWAVSEVVAARLRESRSDTVALTAYTLGAASASSIRWIRVGRDSVAIRVGEEYNWRGALRGGRLQSAAPLPGTTQQYATDRAGGPDVQATAAAWIAREQRSGAVGSLSPRDTTRASIAGASLMVDYSRPSKRGREIFGSTAVPWGQVWRTGANAATQFSTDRALEVGGVVLAPGTYTLWTIPSQAGPWKLLINSQTGQWGTAYDSSRDLYHLDLAITALSRPVEQFTIRVESAGQGGVLHLEWDTTRASIPFTVR